jgi:hypothetical protein
LYLADGTWLMGYHTHNRQRVLHLNLADSGARQLNDVLVYTPDTLLVLDTDAELIFWVCKANAPCTFGVWARTGLPSPPSTLALNEQGQILVGGGGQRNTGHLVALNSGTRRVEQTVRMGGLGGHFRGVYPLDSTRVLATDAGTPTNPRGRLWVVDLQRNTQRPFVSNHGSFLLPTDFFYDPQNGMLVVPEEKGSVLSVGAVTLNDLLR